MTNLQSATVPALVLRRTYAASRERVFDAWTTPDVLQRFLMTGNVTHVEAATDPKTGGTFSITMDHAIAGRLRASGTYLEVKKPSRLVMTWRWEEDSPEEEYDSILTLDLYERDGGTELVLTHEKLGSLESRENHEEGWTEIMAQLAVVLDTKADA